MKIKKGELQAGRFLIPYRIYGDSPKKIICVCGAQQTMAIWRSFVSKHAKDFSIIVFDPPGHGAAKTLSGDASISLDEQIDVVKAVVESTHGETPIKVAAASWGSIIGAGFASKYPDMVKRLCLGSFGGKPSKKMLELIEEGQVMVRENRGAELGSLIVDNFGTRIPFFYKKRIISQFKAMTEHHFLAFYANAELIKNMLDINKGMDLSKITAKTLIVNGELDEIIEVADIQVASSQFPDAEVVIIPDTGHFLHHEREHILDIYYDFFCAKEPAVEVDEDIVIETSLQTAPSLII